METEVVIIGGGIMGVMLARELSRYKVDAVLVDRHPDVGFGTSKSSHGTIYSGLTYLVSKSLKAIATSGGGNEAHFEKDRLCHDGYEMWEGILRELDVPYCRRGDTVIARNEEELSRLKLMQRAAKPEWNFRLLNREELFSLEPHVTPEAIAGLHDADHVLTCYPWDIVIAVAENARENGVKFFLDAEVRGFSRSNGFTVVETTRGPIKTEFVINATGPWGADVAKLADACDFELKFFKGHTLITDKRAGDLVNNSVHWPPTPGTSKVIQPTLSGTLRLGSIYRPTEDKDDDATDAEDIETVFQRAHDLVPALSRNDIITCFTGMRVFSARDPEEYIMEYAPHNKKFLNVILRLPGFTPAPAVAGKVLAMLEEAGLKLRKKEDFNPYRKRIPIFRELSDEERNRLIAQDPKWGHVVCRCETVTEAEILEAIRRGATTLDGIKFRTRAGMGRCQSGFCGPRVVEILAKTLGIAPTQVSKKGGNSRIVLQEGKELLREKGV